MNEMIKPTLFSRHILELANKARKKEKNLSEVNTH